MFPRASEQTVLDKLDTYLRDAYARSENVITDSDDRDLFARHWANARALSEVHKRVLINPSSVALGDQGSGSWLLTQIQDIERIALEERALADALLLTYEEVDVVAEAPITRSSACVPTVFTP